MKHHQRVLDHSFGCASLQFLQSGDALGNEWVTTQTLSMLLPSYRWCLKNIDFVNLLWFVTFSLETWFVSNKCTGLHDHTALSWKKDFCLVFLPIPFPAQGKVSNPMAGVGFKGSAKIGCYDCLLSSPLLSLAPRLEAGSGVLWLSLEVTGGCVVSWCPNCWSHDDLYTFLFFHDFDPMLIPDDFSIRLIWLFTISWPPLSTSRWSVVEGFWLAMEHHRFWKRSNKSWRRLNAENRWKLVVLSDNFT